MMNFTGLEKVIDFVEPLGGVILIFVTGVWIMLLCIVSSFRQTTREMQPEKLGRSNALLPLIAMCGPLIYSFPGLWFLGLPAMFCFGCCGLVFGVQSYFADGRKMGSGLIVGVVLGMFCRAVISVGSGGL